jgi:hypothetical protein
MIPLAVLMLGLAATTAFATDVTYSTSGAFSGGAGCISATCTKGTTTVTFSGQASDTVGAPTFVDLGTFAESGTKAGTGTYNVPFTLTITQSSPSGNGTDTAKVSGTITIRKAPHGNSSTVTVSFNSSTVKIGKETYVLSSTLLTVPPPGGGDVAIEAKLTAVPEPTSLLLFGTGLAGLAGLVYKRRKS